MFERLTPLAKICLFVALVLVVGAVGYFTGALDGFLGKGKLTTGAQPVAPGDVMQISLDEWIGWKPILDANGGVDTQPGSIYDSLGLKLHINIINDATQSSTSMINGSLAGAGYTINRYAFLYNKFKSSNCPVRMVYLVNASAGGDGVIAKDGINSIEDLKDKKIAVPKFSEAQTLIEWLLSKSSLSSSEVNGIRRKFVYFNTPDDAAKACFAGQVDAAATWQPYLSQASSASGMHVLFSTKNATNLVLDGIVFRADYLAKNGDKVKAFIKGALKAASMYDNNFTAIKNTMPLFSTETDENIKGMTADAILLDCASNVDRGNGIAQALFTDMSNVWKSLGEAADPGASSGAFDFSLVSALSPEFPATATKAPAFTESQRQAAMNQNNDDALLAQRLTINFATGTAQLTAEGKAALDVFADTVKLLNGVIIQIEGNTDNVGNAASNKELSLKRAMAVKMYLQYQHGIDPSRFNVVGNGPDKPVMDNSTEDGKAANRRTDVFLKVVQ